MDRLKTIGDKVIAGDRNEVARLAQEEVDAGTPPLDIINKGLLPGMAVIAKRFKANEIYLPEVLIAARAMHAGVDVVKPLISESETQSAGTVVLGTVRGDLHDIGKRLVGLLLEGAGFKVVDIGIDVAPETFASAVREHKPNLIGLSALLTTTMPSMESVISHLVDEGLRDSVKVMIGGAPVTEEYAQRIGADGYAMDAGSAVELAQSLCATG